MGVKKGSGVKKNSQDALDYVTKQAIKNKTARQYWTNLALQQFMDYSVIALNEEFQFGPKYLLRYYTRMAKVTNEFSNRICDESEESKHDKLEPKSFVVTQNDLEAKLKKALGDLYEDYNSRYSDLL